MTTVVDGGGYDSVVKSYEQIWATYRKSDPDNFQHENDFKSAIGTLADNEQEFLAAIGRDPTSFAQTVAAGHELGRVITQHELWDDFPGVEGDHRNPQVNDVVLQFCAFETNDEMPPTSRNVVEYHYNISKLEIESRSIVKTMESS